MRIGHGYDVHKLVSDRKLVLGGVEIPHELGLLGHSDADVLTHAIMDALLGAAGLGDIGRHFPDTDGRYKGISSIVLLETVMAKITQKGYCIGNVDCTIIAQKPKLAPYLPEMCEHLSDVLQTTQLNIKATTEEGLGFTGRQEGIACHAVCILETT